MRGSFAKHQSIKSNTSSKQQSRIQSRTDFKQFKLPGNFQSKIRCSKTVDRMRVDPLFPVRNRLQQSVHCTPDTISLRANNGRFAQSHNTTCRFVSLSRFSYLTWNKVSSKSFITFQKSPEIGSECLLREVLFTLPSSRELWGIEFKLWLELIEKLLCSSLWLPLHGICMKQLILARHMREKMWDHLHYFENLH